MHQIVFVGVLVFPFFLFMYIIINI